MHKSITVHGLLHNYSYLIIMKGLEIKYWAVIGVVAYLLKDQDRQQIQYF